MKKIMKTAFLALSKETAFARVMTTQMQILRQSGQELMQGTNPQALHDFRIALRRMRAWLKIVGPLVHGDVRLPFRKKLEEMTEATNWARDAEVQLDLLEWLGKGEVTAPQVQRVKHAYIDVRRRVDSELALILREVASHMPNEKISARGWHVEWQHCVLKSLRKIIRKMKCINNLKKHQKLHRARITIKEMRYLVEPLEKESLDIAQLVAKLRHMQDTLGELHDLHLAIHNKTLRCIRNDLKMLYKAKAQDVIEVWMEDFIRALKRIKNDFDR